ncbi:MAG: microcystin degradation protein MlrC [Gemmatimonadetes bacterium]|nr:microcystin degradation protein MlrC [Gemmatimonadota bacterium]|tara:strand:- start:5351 stop:6826 length:1476 start_codon:yes stop_codon:yes gene_type:complete
MPIRIAIASYGQETSSFSPELTTLDTFRQYGLHEGKDILENCRGVASVGGFLETVDAAIDWEPLPIIHGWAGANGPLTPETLEFFHHKVVEGLRSVGEIEILYFALHGAGEAQNEPDTEGHLLEAARSVLGPEVPIVISLDHHANLTDRMVRNCNALVGHRTQPHDQPDTGRLAGQILVDIANGRITPTLAHRKIPLITHQEQFLTSKGPMKQWFDLAREIESRDGVVSASNFPMQPWLDVPEGGWATAVVTDNDPELARQCVDELARAAWDLRDDFLLQESIPIDEAVHRAEAAPEGLVILSDTGDSVFGGASGDSTHLLGELLRQNIQSVALVPMVDAAAVAKSIEAGIGATVDVSLGGKLDTVFCRPVDVTATVQAIGGGRIDMEVTSHGSFDMGRAVLLEAGPVRIVVSEERGIGGNHPVVYEHFGIDIAGAKIAVLKTASNWQYYDAWTREVIRADTSGATMSDIAGFDWKHLPRPIYPLDAETTF